MELDELIRKYALKNAHDYGKASPNAVVGKVVAENNELKVKIKEIIELAKRECGRINSMDKKEIANELDKYEFKEAVGKEEREWKVDNAVGKEVVTRYSPEPNGYMHIGHAKTVFINEAVSKKYGGKQILKFDDTNPKSCKQEFVDAIIGDCKWLEVGFNRIVFVSSIMDKIAEYGKKLIDEEKAYVCTCSLDLIRTNRGDGKECMCRERSSGENNELWESMKRDMSEGEAIVRFKGSMKSQNTVMRDPAIFRIVEHEHYRLGSKYRVWPTYDFENPVSDFEFGITHVLRSKEFELRAELHTAILKALNLNSITYYEYARLNLEGYPVSKRLIKPYVEGGFFSGYDDPRLVTIAGLRRRGIPPEAIKRFALSFGLSKQEVKTDLKKLIAEARKYYDPRAKRYFAVRNPIKIIVDGLKNGVVGVRLHPIEEMGIRKMSFSNEILIDENDYAAFKIGDVVRLKDLRNVEITDEGKARVIEDQTLRSDIKKIQWVDSNNSVLGKLWVLDKPFVNNEPNKNSIKIAGIACERGVEKIPEKEVVQFERVGFCILDDKSKRRFIKID